MISPDKALPKNLPIWILHFWRRIHETYQLRGRWKVCNDWVASRPHISTKLQDQFEKTIVNTCWQGSLNSRWCNWSTRDIFDLLSNNELNTGQVEDLLKLVERNLPSRSDGAAFPLIASMVLTQVLTFAHQERDNLTFQRTWIQAMVEDSLIEGRNSSVASVA